MSQQLCLESESPSKPETLLGGGADITGREVEFWGHVWTVESRNYLGWWDVVRRESRPDGVMKITTQIAPDLLPETHPKFARLLPAEPSASVATLQ